MPVLQKIGDGLRAYGLDAGRMWSFRALPRFVREARAYRRLQESHGGLPFRWSNIKPALVDYHDSAGVASGDYFNQDLWCAQRIFKNRPARHVDIGSRFDGFIAHVLSFMPIEVIDFRPLSTTLEGLTFIQADATNLADISDDSIESISSLNAIEHFGLGRYGVPIDPQASFKAMRSMARVVARGGRLYFGGPIGRERVDSNSHRVFAPATILSLFAGEGLKLLKFSGINHAGLTINADPQAYANDHYSCGLWMFTK